MVSVGLVDHDAFVHAWVRQCLRDTEGTLGIGMESVKTFLSRAFAKLGVRNRIEAVADAKRRGLL